MDHSAVMSANRLTGRDVRTLAVDLDQPEDIILYHDLKQPAGTEPSRQNRPRAPCPGRAAVTAPFLSSGTDWCRQSNRLNGGCEFLCLPAPLINQRSAKFTCACPDATFLGADARACVTGPVATPGGSSTGAPLQPEAPTTRPPFTATTGTPPQTGPTGQAASTAQGGRIRRSPPSRAPPPPSANGSRLFFCFPGNKLAAVPGEAPPSHPVALYVVLPMSKFPQLPVSPGGVPSRPGSSE